MKYAVKSYEKKGGVSRGPLAVCLLSGGVDSLVTAAIAIEDGLEPAFLHINYGQRTEARELRAFNDICDFYNSDKRLIVDLGYFKKIGGSALTDSSIAIPKDTVSTDNIPVTYVPFRNAHMLSVAVSWAEVIGAFQIYIGATQVDFSGYPDCRREFFDAMENAIREGTRPETNIKIVTPIINMTKSEVVKKGLMLNAPFELSWSCYEREDRACGRCESCLLRLKGFSEANAIDPIMERP